MDKLAAFGSKGTILLVGRGFKEMSWKDADFRLDMKVEKDINKPFNLLFLGLHYLNNANARKRKRRSLLKASCSRLLSESKL